jgi:hypothetical protein
MLLAKVEVLHFGSILPSKDKSKRKGHPITSLAHLRRSLLQLASRKARDSLLLASAVSSRRVRIQSQPFKHEQAKTHFSLLVRYGDTMYRCITIRGHIQLL